MRSSPSRSVVIVVAWLATSLWPGPGYAAPQRLRVVGASLSQATSSSGANGRATLDAMVDDAAGGDIEATLLSNGVLATVQDGGQFNVTLPVTGCVRRTLGVRCRSGRIRLKLENTAGRRGALAQ